MAQSFQTELGNLIGERREPISSTLIFRFKGKDPLYVRSGANAIKWNYLLNTQSTPTIGGEVVQVLSCAVGPITIEGMAAGYQTTEKISPQGYRPVSGYGGFTPVDEMTHIIQWFLSYMHRAGTLRNRQEFRDETAVKFEYPARNWEFWLQITDLQGFEVAKDQVGVPWSITAEIVNDPALDFLVTDTMTAFTDSLTSRRALQKIIGADQLFAANPFVNPQLGQYTMTDLASRLGDNFQALVAAWTGGVYPSYGFSALADPGAQTSVTNPYDIYNTVLGGEYIGEEPKTDYGGTYAGSGGSSTGSQNIAPDSTESIYGGTLRDYIICLAKSKNLDPAAVMAVVEQEGGLNGAVGDNGTSFGPWQLHGGSTVDDPTTDGSLPQAIWSKGAKYARQWANSPAGINHAMNGIASVATGATGLDAITKIVSQFERPANPSGEISDAWARYQYWNKIVDGVDCTGGGGSQGSFSHLGPAVPGDTSILNYVLTHRTGGIEEYVAFDTPTGWGGRSVIAPEDMDLTLASHARRRDDSPDGLAVYATGASGLRYWFGHIENVLPIGTSLKKGQPFATVSYNHEAPHLHVGIDASFVRITLSCGACDYSGNGSSTLRAQLGVK